jgi:hypothetical protein
MRIPIMTVYTQQPALRKHSAGQANSQSALFPSRLVSPSAPVRLRDPDCYRVRDPRTGKCTWSCTGAPC